MKSPAPSSARSIDQQKGSKTQDAAGTTPGSALRGASLAFQAPPPTPKPLVNTYSGTNGALAAATRAGLGQQKNLGKTIVTTFEIQAPKMPVDPLAVPHNDRLAKRATSGTIESLRQSRDPSSNRQQSPSYIAATLAAARSTPTPVNGPATPTAMKGQNRARFPSHDHKDESSIPATNALVQLFESKCGSNDIKKEARKPSSEPTDPQPARNIVSPQPIRPHLSLRLSSRTLNETAKLHNNNNVESRPALPKEVPIRRPASASAVTQTQVTRALATASKMAPKPPPPRGIRRPTYIRVPSKEDDEDPSPSPRDTSSTSSYTSARDVLSRTNTLNQSQTLPPKPPKPLSTPSLTPKSAQPAKTPSPPPNKPLIPRRASARPYTSVPAPSRLSPQLTADSLATAMVASSLASSLASSRATSPSKQIPPLLRRHSRPYSLFLPGHQHFPSRTPSPTKTTGMRHTLRKEISSDSEEKEERDRKRHHHILKKHPNKHAEGDRKRWRDSITERERKRYEGVWAANKGLLLSRPLVNNASSSSLTLTATRPEPNILDCVHALIVKDLWCRSQLSLSTLAEIWELVDGLQEGRLRREEFVVGLWLVDQCLKGRKLPVRVGESVWESVRGLRGVRLVGGGGGVRGRG
ncbi:Increased rDNA silencing protein [Trapelia coarctata]|nr:Increased rDNA silencing protein [Trapelia coarctata]